MLQRDFLHILNISEGPFFYVISHFNIFIFLKIKPLNAVKSTLLIFPHLFIPITLKSENCNKQIDFVIKYFKKFFTNT